MVVFVYARVGFGIETKLWQSMKMLPGKQSKCREPYKIIPDRYQDER